jgi:condensin-2 complex subunit D3
MFVFRFLAAIADPDDEVSCLAQTSIRGPLLEKQPNLLCSSLVESIFVFNSCKAHPIYAAASNGGAGYVEIDFNLGLLEGKEGYQRRHEVYQMMLDNMTDEQKLKVTTDIVKRILGGAMDSRGDFGIVCRLAPNGRANISDARLESATHVLRDAFTILSSPHIKVGRRATEEEVDEVQVADGTNGKVDQRSLNKDRLLSKISQKHLMEIVIPVLCNLKSILEGSHSALLKDLMKYLGYIFRSFKLEVMEHLANDPTLLQELEYDMRQFEKKERESIIVNTEVVAVA